MEDNKHNQMGSPAGEISDTAGGSAGGKRVLVPLDGSPLAEMALPHAIALARATQPTSGMSESVVALLRVVPPLSLMDPTGGLVASSGEIWEVYEEEPKMARDYLQDVAGRLAPAGLHVEIFVAVGDPAEEIVKYAQEHPEVEAIAMSTHGRSGVGRWLFGSVAEKVLHSSPVPLLLVRPDGVTAQPDLAAVPRYETLLVPLDGSVFAEQALEQAEGLARATDGSLVLLSVAHTPFDLKLVKTEAGAGWSAEPWDAHAERLVKYLDGITQELALADVPVQAQVTYGDVADEILKTARLMSVDLIVMATHGRSGLGHLMIGSIAGRVAQEARVPLLLVRVKGTPGSERHPRQAQETAAASS